MKYWPWLLAGFVVYMLVRANGASGSSSGCGCHTGTSPVF